MKKIVLTCLAVFGMSQVVQAMPEKDESTESKMLKAAEAKRKQEEEERKKAIQDAVQKLFSGQGRPCE